MYAVEVSSGNINCFSDGTKDLGHHKFGECVEIDRDDETKGMIVNPRYGYDGFYVNTYPDKDCQLESNDYINMLSFDNCLNGLNNSYHLSWINRPDCQSVDLFEQGDVCIPVNWSNSQIRSIHMRSKDVENSLATGPTFTDTECQNYYKYETFDRNICIGNV